jgi:hypothetical protein
MDRVLHHPPDSMLTVLAVGICITLIAIAVLRLVSTTRGNKI